MKKLFLILIIFTLSISCVYASQNLADFKVDEIYASTFNDSECIIYSENNYASGVGIFKYIDIDDNKSDDVIDNVIMDDGADYLKVDEEYQLTKNPDNTANFTDLDHGNHGVVELVDVGGEKFVIVFWMKNSNNNDNTQLMSQLTDFNKNNNLSPIAF